MNAIKFDELHHRKEPLILYNCWNASTAKIINNSSQLAIATSSYAIADSLGFADGEEISFNLLFKIISGISSVSTKPLTVDIETGYGENYLKNIGSLVDLGVVGINIEDRIISSSDYTLVDPIEQGNKIRTIKEFIESKKQKLFINARTDLFFKYSNHDTSLCDLAIKRSKIYKNAGANCIFVPGLIDLSLIEYIVKNSPLPVNIMISEGSPSIKELSKVGVKRISFGPTSYFDALHDFEERIARLNDKQY